MYMRAFPLNAPYCVIHAFCLCHLLLCLITDFDLIRKFPFTNGIPLLLTIMVLSGLLYRTAEVDLIFGSSSAREQQTDAQIQTMDEPGDLLPIFALLLQQEKKQPQNVAVVSDLPGERMHYEKLFSLMAPLIAGRTWVIPSENDVGKKSIPSRFFLT